MQTTLKAFISGSLVEVFEYTKPILYGTSYKQKTYQSSVSASDNEATKDFSREISTYRTKSNIRRLISSNCSQWQNSVGAPFLPVFGTFTFADNIKDITQANKSYTDFIKRLNYVTFQTKVATLKYLNIVEFQKRGAVHYHCIFFNLPFRRDIKQLLSTHWSHGFSQIKAINRIRNLGVYISKYLSKDFDEFTMSHRKLYFISKGLHKPLTVCYDELIADIMALVP